MPITSSEIGQAVTAAMAKVEAAEALFAAGMKSIKVAEKLRIPVSAAMEIKHAWLIKNAPPKAAKAEKPAPKAKKAKANE